MNGTLMNKISLRMDLYKTEFKRCGRDLRHNDTQVTKQGIDENKWHNLLI